MTVVKVKLTCTAVFSARTCVDENGGVVEWECLLGWPAFSRAAVVLLAAALASVCHFAQGEHLVPPHSTLLYSRARVFCFTALLQ